MNDPDTDHIRARLLQRVIADNGGTDAPRMARDFFAGASLREIAAKYNVPESSARRRIARLTDALRSVDLLPESWQSRDRLRSAPKSGA